MNKIIMINYNFKSNDTNLYGQIFIPFINDVIYKPIRFTVYDGLICDSFKRLSGKKGKEKRIFKEKLILNNSEETNKIGVYKLSSPYEFNGNIGYVKIASLLSGYNTNRNSKLKLVSNDKKINNTLLGKFFRNPASFKGDITGSKIISFDKLRENHKELMDKIISEYDGDFKSITKLTERIKNGTKI